MSREKKAKQLVRDEIKFAQNALGRGYFGWRNAPIEVKKGLVSLGILTILRGQDDGVSAEARVALLTELHREMDRQLNEDDDR